MLPKSVIKEIRNEVDDVYNRIRSRFLGDKYKKKGIIFEVKNDTLDEFFKKILELEGGEYNKDVLDTLKDVCGSYLDASREKAKAQVINAIQAIIRESVLSGEVPNIRTAIEGQMTKVWGDASKHVETILNAEINTAKNVSILEGITEYNAKIGVDDPVVFFVIVRDGVVCSECVRLHMLPDGVTPRLWYMSEVGNGYHKKGDNNPKIGGLHPSCRCSLSTLLLGYGFNDSGKVTYIGKGHSEIDKQRGINKSEELAKSTTKTLETGLWDHIKQYVDSSCKYDRAGRGLLAYEPVPPSKYNYPPEPTIANFGNDEEEKKMNNSPIVVHFPESAIDGILSFGKMKNQFETRTTRGNASLDARKKVENYLFGIPEEHEGELRPLYGALHTNLGIGHNYDNGVSPMYGNLWFELHPHVKERSTFFNGDSLNDFGSVARHGQDTWGSRHVRSNTHTWPNVTKMPLSKKSKTYLEAQIHGGIYLDKDVKNVHFNVSEMRNGKLSPAMPEEAHLRSLKKMSNTYGFPVLFNGAPDHVKMAQEIFDNL
jgi:hypothetical protein